MPYGTESSHDVSILQLAFVDHWQRINQRQLGAGDRFVGIFEGGNQQLPIAMAKRLNGDLLLDRHVVAIEQTKENILVRCSDGSRHHARAVVSSMPFTTLRHVHLDPLPAPLQNRAIQTLGAKPITQFHLLPRRPFWDDDGLSPAFWTDGLAGSVLANRDPKDPKTVTSLTVWCSAANARFLDRYSEADAARIVIAEIERLRPAARGALDVAAVHSWERDPHAAGTWAIFRPGQVALTSHLAKPHNKLFFCGEHTALAARGMEAAFESAERVSLEVLDALS
jgi:monoamine oxidase